MKNINRVVALLATATLVGWMTSAQAQTPSMSSGKPKLGFPLGDEKKAPDDPQSAEHESAYKSAIEKIPPKQTSNDPWQGLRANAKPQGQKPSQ